MQPARGNFDLSGHLKNLGRWIVLIPVVLLVLFSCGQLALVSTQSPIVSGPLTKLKADYQVWEFTEFHPVQSAILEEIRKDRAQNATAIILPGQVWPSLPAPHGLTPPAAFSATPAPDSALTPTPALPLPSSTPLPLPSATRPLIFPATATEQPPRVSTGTRVPTLTFTLTPTETKGPTPTFTFTPTETKEPSPTFTFTPTETKGPTPTFTFTPTETREPSPTFTFTPTTAVSSLNIGGPDGVFASLYNGLEWTIDLQAEIGRPLDTSLPDGNYDLVYYERVNYGSQIAFDHVILQIGTGPSGSCSSGSWFTVLYWGDSDSTNNGHLGNLFGPTEVDNQAILTSQLYNNTGIAIDVDALGYSGIYPCLKLVSPLSGDGDASEIDAIEILP